MNSIRSGFNIPYYHAEKNTAKSIESSANRRKMSKSKFLLRKTKNILLFRLAFFCPVNRWRITMHRWRGVNIGKNVYIGIQCAIDNAYPEYVSIEDNVSIVNETTILAHSNPMSHFEGVFPSFVAPVVVKNGAWIGVKSIILPGVTVGVKSVVSAGSVVVNNVNDFTLVAGNPAKKVAEFDSLLE